MKLLITKKAEKELDKLPDKLAKTIAGAILVLAQNPYPPNSKKLSGQNNYRLRVGSYRVLYTVDKKKREVVILRIAHRHTIYRRF